MVLVELVLVAMIFGPCNSHDSLGESSNDELESLLQTINEINQQANDIFVSEHEFTIDWNNRTATVYLSAALYSNTPTFYLIIKQKRFNQLYNLNLAFNCFENSAHLMEVTASDNAGVSGNRTGQGTWLMKFSNFILCKLNITHSQLYDASNFEFIDQDNGTQYLIPVRLIRLSQGKFNTWYSQFGYQSINDTLLGLHMKWLHDYPLKQFYNDLIESWNTTIYQNGLFSTIQDIEGLNPTLFDKVLNLMVTKTENTTCNVGSFIAYCWQQNMYGEIAQLLIWISNFFHSKHEPPSFNIWNAIMESHTMLCNKNNQCQTNSSSVV